MLLRKARYRRRIAATLMAVMLSNTILPVISFALTSGPTAPEATSFEPVDTTDMVNLQTGDFTYNIPLLEVPGPEGGYPLSLSYHAGIQPNEDASWVGLGWTLNPGAINRNVNGYPDDWYNPQNNSHVYMEEGVTKTYSVGVNIGIANAATVGVNLSFSDDSYKGFSTGGLGLSASLGKSWKIGNVGVNASIGIGMSSSSGTYVSGGVNARIGSDINANFGIGFSTNFKSLNAGASGGIGYGSGNSSLLGASIRTGGGQASFSAAWITSSVSGSEDAGVQTDVSSFSIDIPVSYFNVSLGYNKRRSWIDKSTNVYTHGSIYGSGWGEISETIGGNSMTNMVPYDMAFDSYALLEDPAEKNIVDYPDPNQVQGGAYPDFDNYRVVAQGLGGSMRPYLFQGEVLGQNRKKADGSRSVNYYSPGVTNAQPQFRFEGDFSNSYRQNFNAYSNPALNLRSVVPPFATPTYGDGDGTYGYSGGKLAGTRHIDIGPAIKPSNSKGYNKSDRYSSYMIEGFSITNESGVTYHYGLPAYSWGEENYQEKIKNGGFNQVFFNRGTKSNPYAYTWYLTTITGPDFVDRNGNGIADGNDWGYWVNFEYGKWTNNYVWRNPSEGYHRDEDNEFQNCSIGKKEIYYLNAIRTRSHIALFEKDIRLDGKGASPQVFNKATKQDYQYAGLFNINSSQSLRLDRIYLLNASDSLFVLPSSGNSNAYKPLATRTVSCSDCELAANVLERTDVDAVNRFTLEEKAIRIIDFSYDYSLCPRNTNSFDINTPTVKSGKLTLKNILCRGKEGSSVIPPTRFEYELDPADQRSISGRALTGLTGTGSAEVGDLLVSADVNQDYVGVIVKKTLVDAGFGTYNYTLSGGVTTVDVNKTYRTTKNPPYHKDSYDAWGMYKSDYQTALINNNEALGRQTSLTSAKSVDSWSLRNISSASGGIMKINYESDTYCKSVLFENYAIEIVKFDDISNWLYGPIPPGAINGNLKLNFFTTNGLNLNDVFKVGDPINFIFYKMTTRPSMPTAPYESCQKFFSRYYPTYTSVDTKNFTTPPIINQIGADYIVVNNDEFKNYYKYAKQAVTNEPSCVLTEVPAKGNLSISNRPILFGGGIRVKSLKHTQNESDIMVSYSYNHPGNASISSGITSYEPSVMQNPMFPVFGNELDIPDEARKEYKRLLYKDNNELFVLGREIPPPGVIYEYVTVTTSIKNSGETVARQVAGSTAYQFEVFRENMIYRNMTETPYTHNVITHGTIDSRNISIKKFLHGIGSTRRIIQYDKDGKKLSETVNHFLHDGLENDSPSQFFNHYKSRLSSYSYIGHTYDLRYQGLIQERFSEVKTVDEKGWTSDSQVKATLSAREDYPYVPLGQTVINYVNGIQTTSQTLGFDFYSGAPVKSVQTDGYGNRFMTETTPAYRKYSSMGLKVGTASNKNMLTQTAATTVYKVNASNTRLGIVSAGVEVWSNTVPSLDMAGAQVVQSGGTNGNVWRLKSSYNWMPVNTTTDGLTTTGNFSEFNFATPGSSHANWKKTSENTLNDVYSKALEATDINDNYAATRLNHLSRKVELSGSPAKFYEIAFSG
ncbi:MAG TPA: hypothetical protein PL085_18945, partial [Agriterribacter sp.]|nr:hypothetical protein [Agriterribacter sp.]HRQ19161.1 hypothetical protein [Agriterribacter sp.]